MAHLPDLEKHIKKMKASGMSHKEICRTFESENQERVERGIERATKADKDRDKAAAEYTAAEGKYLGPSVNGDLRYKTLPLGVSAD
jgi:hypothetical protein